MEFGKTKLQREALLRTATDTLGSVRQIIDASGTVQFAQSYEPYGDVLESIGVGESSYGFAGEWTDSYIKLIYLRSRYYAPTTGRFLTKDVWQGDYTRPLSLNRWNYVEGNPVRYTDPSGMYHKEVHLDLTRSLVRQINPVLASLRNPSDPTQTLADAIAEANQHVDGFNLNAFSCFECHFKSYSRTSLHVYLALNSNNVVLFGASLHQLQDYFSHWREGYIAWDGHVPDSISRNNRKGLGKFEDFFNGGHNESQFGNTYWVASPFLRHDREMVISDILYRNPGMTRSDLGDDDLIIDLYLRRDPEFSGTLQSSEQRILERGHFGIDPDLYIANSSRDIKMREITRIYIQMFLQRINSMDPCEFSWEANDQEIRDLLEP